MRRDSSRGPPALGTEYLNIMTLKEIDRTGASIVIGLRDHSKIHTTFQLSTTLLGLGGSIGIPLHIVYPTKSSFKILITIY